MWSVFQLLFGFLIVGLASIWLSGLLLTSIFPLFNCKAEFIEYYTKRTGAPPSRARLTRTPHSLSLIPTAFFLRHVFFQVASILTAIALWVVILIGYQTVKGLF